MIWGALARSLRRLARLCCRIGQFSRACERLRLQMSMFRSLSLLFVSCTVFNVFLPAGADAQGQASVQPPRIRWGDTLHLRYVPPEGKRPERVRAIAFLYLPVEGRLVKTEMQPQGGGFRGRLAVPADVAHGAVHFIADGQWDETAARTFIGLTPRGALPKGAHGRLMLEHPGAADSLLHESLRLYPDYVEAYRHRWIAARERNEEGWDRLIRNHLRKLATDAGESAQAVYTRLSGHLMLGEFQQAAPLMTWLVKEQPQSMYTGRALQRFRYEQFSTGDSALSNDVLASWTSSVARAYPASSLARETLWQFVEDSSWTIAEIDQIVEPWIASEPDNPMPYLFAADARMRRGITAGTEEYLRTATTALLAGGLRTYGDLAGTGTRDRLRQAYYLWSRAAAARGDTALATGLAAAATGLHSELDRAEIYLHSAELWQHAGMFENAEHDLVEAAQHSGGAEIERELRELHARWIARGGGFADYFQNAVEQGSLAGTPRFLPAFVARDLDNQPAGSRELAGKVGVLNFWFTTCLPCLVEIPKLNAMMKEFSDAPVSFVAYALDDAATLRAFLGANPFAYSIVPEAADIAERFGVEAYPLHVLVDQNGRVRMAVKGGEEETLARMRSGIEKLLREAAAR